MKLPVAPVQAGSLYIRYSVPKGKCGEGNQEKMLSTLYIREDIKLVS